MKTCIVLIAAFGFLVLSAHAQQVVKEPSTGKAFPLQVMFSQDGKDYALTLTGTAVRKKFVFKVYGMAHYMQDVTKGSKENAFSEAVSDRKAKQIIMDFARDVDAAKIKETYSDGFKEHSTPEEYKQVEPSLKQFLSYFSKDVKENDQFILRSLPGGTVIAVIQGDQKPAITDGAFARILWSLWLGKDAVVDRDDLVERMIE